MFETLIEAGKATRLTPSIASELAKRRWAQAKPAPTIAPPADNGAEYLTDRLAQARKHLQTASQRLQMALDDAGTLPVDIERLSRAVSALSETERKLSGRPDPGVLKPTVDRRARQPVSLPEPT